MDEIALN